MPKLKTSLLHCGKNETMDWSIDWAYEYIEYFNKTKEFDPFDVIADTESMHQQLYKLCVEYLNNLDDLTAKFMQDRKKIVFNK